MRPAQFYAWEYNYGFNPRTPCGVRRTAFSLTTPIVGFQSTHSLRSATGCELRPCEMFKVSIHALLAECDSALNALSRRMVCFNPRTPCGVRRLCLSDNDICEIVSIHALLAECDSYPCANAAQKGRFQSTHSLRSATCPPATFHNAETVSIHALLAECDYDAPGILAETRGFNPRTPCGVRRHPA